MSYYADYTLRIHNITRQGYEKAVTFFLEMTDVFHDDYSYNERQKIATFRSCCDIAWYDYDSDLLPLSRKLKSSTLIMDCIGEDKVVWREYYRNGKNERCKGQLKLVFSKPKEIT